MNILSMLCIGPCDGAHVWLECCTECKNKCFPSLILCHVPLVYPVLKEVIHHFHKNMPPMCDSFQASLFV